MNFGSTFRKLRLHKGYNLEFVSKGIISVSFLSKFERNESEISLPKILELLNRINVNFNEFLFIHNGFKKNEVAILMEHLNTAYLQGNIKLLNQLSENEDLKFEKTGLLTYKLNSIMIQSICFDLNQNKLKKRDVDVLVDYLWGVEIWGEYEIILYGNTLHTLDIDSVILLSSELVNKSIYFKKITSYRRDMYGIYLNTIRVCLENNKYKEAELYINVLKNSEIKENFILEKIMLNFYEGILKMKTDYETGLIIAQKNIHILEEVDAKNFAVNFKEYLKSYLR
ncbi:Rgg/GadR/MutR family transcriptional regulator [Bacillus sp. Cr_A10]|uniref:helix-turn-helix domain-containing protein n=1 Tax=Bacillus sp. Cr_A10 TaxID=3033993 RepID=UPI0023D9D14C|nr:Rgg/GadR/MutR family transcriptional regulator [Bacillus sp. Cr_A10]MDF2067467.1 helix-turn-helix domain-containing protein [Bacillus sp. Cr_A10]